jgi:pimeloyl-ACP methyl ester carboxylesterase
LLVGTSSARSNFNLGNNSAVIQVEGTGFNSSTISCVRNSNDAGTSAIVLGHSRGSAVNGNTILQNGDPVGAIIFEGADGTNFVRGASIDCVVDGTPGANDMPGRIVLSTTPDGSASPVERMRVTQAGHFGFYGTDPATEVRALSSGYGLRLLNNSYQESAFGNSGYWILNNTASSGTRYFYELRVQGATKGSITSDGSSTTYATTSDYRLKENVVPLTGAANRLRQIPVHRFNFIAEPDKTVDGFLAHEAQAIVPECVIGEKDAVDENGDPIYQGIDQSKLVPLIIAALQEALAEIESLKARVTALEP